MGQSINFGALLYWAPILLSLIDRERFQQDPIRRGQLQNQIDAANFTNRFNPDFAGEGPRFNIGNPIGDPLSGFGGAFGADPFGNPLTPAQGLIQNTVSRLGAPTNFTTEGIDALSALGNAQSPQFTSGITGQALDVGQRPGFSTEQTTQNVQGINPDFQALGIPQGGRPQPTPLPDLPQTGGIESTLLQGLLAQLGIQDVQPSQGAVGQQGQSADQFNQNRATALDNIAVGIGSPEDFAQFTAPFTRIGQPIDPLTGRVATGQAQEGFAHGTTSVPRTGQFQLHEGEAVIPRQLNPAAGGASQPLIAGDIDARIHPSALPAPPQPQPAQPPQLPQAPQGPIGAEAIFQPLRNQIDAETAAFLRESRNAAGALGSLNTGEFRGAQQDVRSNRLNALNDARLQAGQQFFGQNLAESQFGFDVFSQNRQFDFDVLGRQDDLNLRNQQTVDSLFNLLLQLGFTADQIGAQGVDPALTQQPQLPAIPPVAA